MLDSLPSKDVMLFMDKIFILNQIIFLIFYFRKSNDSTPTWARRRRRTTKMAFMGEESWKSGLTGFQVAVTYVKKLDRFDNF